MSQRAVTLENPTPGECLTYSPRYAVLWRGRQSGRYFFNRALDVCRRMRRRGHLVTLVRC